MKSILSTTLLTILIFATAFTLSSCGGVQLTEAQSNAIADCDSVLDPLSTNGGVTIVNKEIRQTNSALLYEITLNENSGKAKQSTALGLQEVFTQLLEPRLEPVGITAVIYYNNSDGTEAYRIFDSNKILDDQLK